MATPNIVPQIDNDGNLGRHSLRWAGIAAHIISSPVLKIVKDVSAEQEESVQLSVNADGDLVLGTGADAVVAATATDITLLQTAIDLLAGTDQDHPTVQSIVAAFGDFKQLVTLAGNGANLDQDFTDLVSAVNTLKAQVGNGGVDFSNIASSMVPDANSTRDLGTAEKKWRDLYLSDSTIHLGDAQISIVNNKLTYTPADVEGVAQNPVAVGREITASAIVNGELVLTFSDNSTQNLGAVVGPAGADGAQGPAGADGAQGPQGIQGPAGNDGAQGPQGIQGPAGNDGADGADGAQGPAGADGAQGPQGPQGPQGVEGPAGAAGTGITFRGSVATANDLPDQNVSSGDAYIVQSDDSLHIYDGANFVSGGSIQGPQGAQGPQGPAGADGAVGPQGPAGADGAVGPQGPAGADGAVGPQGPQGPAGADGAQGPQGIQGPAGNDGADGADGAVGPQGAQGPQGPAGTQGAGFTGGSYDANTGVVTFTSNDNLGFSTGDLRGAAGGGSSNKYLLRLEYNASGELIVANTSFVTGNANYASQNASISAQTAGAGVQGHTVTLQFANEAASPISILGYGWDPATGNYKVSHYDRDTNQVSYEVGLASFSSGSTANGGSGDAEQFSGNALSSVGTYTFTLIVDKPTLQYGNAVLGGFGQPSRFAHSYIVVAF